MLNKKYIVALIIFPIVFTACLRKQEVQVVKNEAITLTFYGLFDNEDLYAPIIKAFETENKTVSIIYKKFTDPESYLTLIVNELAEGKGPDIFMLHNTWFPDNYKKLKASPSTIVTPETFRTAFVQVAADDMIIPDANNVEQVYGAPIYVDTLALYYNQDQLNDAVPERGKPASTWDGIVSDVTKLNKQDNSYERFKRSGIAMGRSDNILRSFDILMLLFLQNKVNFYTSDLRNVDFENDTNAVTALDLYSSFGLPSKSNYSWNKYISDADSSEKEITTFAKGKVSMIFGYSYTYEDILNEISRLKALGEETIDVNSIQIQEVPQMFEPSASAETRKTYASYFAPVVARTSANSDMAWKFIATMVSETNQIYLNENTHRPSGRRSLIASQSEDPIYGAFADQVGYAQSIPMYNFYKYKTVFLNAISEILTTADTAKVIKQVAEEIQNLIPVNGIKPVLKIE